VIRLPLQALYFEDLTIGLTESFSKTVSSSDVVGFAEVSPISALLGTRLLGPGAVYISQTLNFRAPVRIADTVT
jgi:3-hydroxybutyryl-CoA dehydratase